MSVGSIAIITTQWRTRVIEPGCAAYFVGQALPDQEYAEWFRDNHLRPRVGKKHGYRRGTKFQIVRCQEIETIMSET